MSYLDQFVDSPFTGDQQIRDYFEQMHHIEVPSSPRTQNNAAQNDSAPAIEHSSDPWIIYNKSDNAK